MTQTLLSEGSGEKVRLLYAQAVQALNRAQWKNAATLIGEVLPLMHEHAGVQFVAGVAALGLNDLRAAVAHLRTAVRLNPARPDYLAQLARAYATSGGLREATEVAVRALDIANADALSSDTLGVVLTRCNEHALAARAFAQAVRLLPKRAGYRYNLATSLLFAGDMEAAEREYQVCVELEPQHWKAHLSLSQLRTQSRENNHLQRLKTLLCQYEQDSEANLYLNLALAKELEDIGDYPASLAHLVAGKQRVARSRGYDSQGDAALFSDLAAQFDGRKERLSGSASSEPIFVLGMPRTGTTLVERILSNHPMVYSAGELMNFPLAVRRLSGATGRALLDRNVVERSATMDWAAVGDMYLRSTRPGTGKTPHFVDKLPHNFQYVGHILNALPNAKIVLLRRDAMDTCLGNFRQLFAMESSFYDYSYDLLDVGRYYIQFERLMQHWLSVFPERIFQVRYEELVSHQEDVTRGLLEYCGLPWDEACLHFQENKAPTATASAVQVRESLHPRFLQRWRRYGVAMEPLRRLLEESGISVPQPLSD